MFLFHCSAVDRLSGHYKKNLARIKPRSQGMAIGQASPIKTLTSEILNSKVLKSLGRLHRGHSKVLKGLGHLH